LYKGSPILKKIKTLIEVWLVDKQSNAALLRYKMAKKNLLSVFTKFSFTCLEADLMLEDKDIQLIRSTLAEEVWFFYSLMSYSRNLTFM